jgi:hypothetical protein
LNQLGGHQWKYLRVIFMHSDMLSDLNNIIQNESGEEKQNLLAKQQKKESKLV